MSKLSDNLNPTQKAIRRISKPIDSGMVGAGKLPPQSVDLEEAVLGALMLEKGPLNDEISFRSIFGGSQSSLPLQSKFAFFAILCGEG